MAAIARRYDFHNTLLFNWECRCGVDLAFLPVKVVPEPGAPSVKPAVFTHPDTGRQALYVNARVSRFHGMTETESKPIIALLCAHATQPEFVYRHAWRAHDLVMWDNRCTLHQALGDFDQTQPPYIPRICCARPCSARSPAMSSTRP